MQIQSSRYLRHFCDHDGALHIEAKLAPDLGARVVSAICAEADAIFRQHRKEDRPEPACAYRADALVALVKRAGAACGSDPRRGGADSVVIRVDASALRRGHAQGKELCEIRGVGQVPLATVKRLLPESFVKILVKDSVDVLSVCHVGRLVSAHVQSTLEERDGVCVVPGCDVSFGLEAHHWREEFAKCKTTALSGLCRICPRHHDMVSYRGFKITGGPGRWELVTPRTGGAEEPSALDSS